MKLLTTKDKWPNKINDLIYKFNGLTRKEKKYINNKLNKNALNLFINLRYPVDPQRYDPMTKQELLKELKYSRYNE